MISRSSTVSLTNTPAISEDAFSGAEESDSLVAETMKGEETDGWKITKFEKTPPMSTYLLAFANGEFEFIEDSYTSPLTGKVVPLRIYGKLYLWVYRMRQFLTIRHSINSATKISIHQTQYAMDVTKRAMPLYEKIFNAPYALDKLVSLKCADRIFRF